MIKIEFDDLLGVLRPVCAVRTASLAKTLSKSSSFRSRSGQNETRAGEGEGDAAENIVGNSNSSGGNSAGGDQRMWSAPGAVPAMSGDNGGTDAAADSDAAARRGGGGGGGGDGGGELSKELSKASSADGMELVQ